MLPPATHRGRDDEPTETIPRLDASGASRSPAGLYPPPSRRLEPPVAARPGITEKPTPVKQELTGSRPAIAAPPVPATETDDRDDRDGRAGERDRGYDRDRDAGYDRDYDADADDEYDSDDEYGPDDDDADDVDGSPAREWLVMASQLAVGAVGGAALWLGFQWLWRSMPVVALVVALVVITALVWVVRRIRHSDDLQTTVVTVLVGLFVTVSPAALLLLGR